MMTNTYTRRLKPITQKDLDRFWGHVDIRGDDDCWNWTRAQTNGYGLFSAGGQLHRVSRFAYQHGEGLNSKRIEGKLRISTTCRNKMCCNPRHMALHSQQEIFDLMKQRDQITVGSKHRMSKLTEEDVKHIRARYVYHSEIDGCKSIGDDYGVSSWCIRDIITRKTWRHV